MDWFTSDTHWWHRNVIHYCKRPFSSVEEMNEAMIRLWNETVHPHDTVYHLGDFTFGPKPNTPHLKSRLNGHIILIRGNHDRKSEFLKESGFEVYQRLECTMEGVAVTMRHYPPTWTTWNEPPYVGGVFLHGHVHELWRRVGNLINVGVDVWGMKPVTFRQLLECPQDENQVTGHGRCKHDPWIGGSVECTECHGFYDPTQQHNEAPEAM